MNARVLLLLLVTAGFMAAWDGDQAAMQIAVARRSQQRRENIAASAAMANAPADDQAIQTDVQTVSVTQQTSTANLQSSAVPLPEGIAAGTYQAVNQAGTSLRIDVDQNNDAPSRDFYTVDAKDGSRWYLIRVTR